jgi:hypothetical protein
LVRRNETDDDAAAEAVAPAAAAAASSSSARRKGYTPEDLQQEVDRLRSQFGTRLKRHIFEGDIDDKGAVTGYHSTFEPGKVEPYGKRTDLDRNVYFQSV